MPDWLWYAALGFNLGSGLVWWYAICHNALRDRERWDRWRQREDEQIRRWAHVERCSACTAWRNDDNGRLAARGLDDDA
jgi:hypothetical protein